MRGSASFLVIILLLSLLASVSLLGLASASANLVGYWKLDEGSGLYAYDSSGNNNVGTLMNGAQWVDGNVGKGLKFDGIDDFLNVPSSSSLVIHGNQLAVETWIKPTITLNSSTDTTVFLTKGNEYSFSLNQGNESFSDGKIRFDICIKTINYFRSETIETTDDVWMANTWYHLAGTYDGSSLKIYVNGVLENSREVSGELWTQEPTYVEYPLSIGAYTWMDATPPNGTILGHLFFFNGTVDEVKVFDYARSAEEIKSDYNAGNLVGYWKFDEGSGTTAMDSSGWGNNGTLTNGPAWVEGKRGKALSFDGVDDYVRVEASNCLDVTSQVTVEAWVNVRAYVDHEGQNSHIVSRTDDWGGHIYVLSLYPGGQKASYSVNPIPDQHASSSDIQLNVWTHLALTYDGSLVRFYLNGMFDSSYALSPPIETTGNWLAIGCNSYGSTYAHFNGTVDEVRIYKVALRQEDIYLHSHDIAVSDEFSEPILDSVWTWVNPKGDCSFNMTADPGLLRISVPGEGHDLYPLKNFDAPRMVQDVEGDFVVETRLVFDPQYDAQGAGLLVWQNESSYFRLDRLNHMYGQVVCFSGVNESSWGYFDQVSYSGTVTYLMLERLGNTFNAQYSNDGTNWAFLGTISYSFTGSVKLGLFVIDEWQNNPISADFDYFRISHASSTRYTWSMFRADLEHTGYSRSPAPTTNQSRWNYTTGGEVRSSPVVFNGIVFVGSNDSRVYALDQYSGAQIWNFTAGAEVQASPAVADGKVFVGSFNGSVYCLDASTGAKVWNFAIGNVVLSSAAAVDGRVYVGSWDKALYCLPQKDPNSDGVIDSGEVIWTYQANGAITSSPAVVSGRAYVGSTDGTVYCLDSSAGTSIWNYSASGMVLSSPAVTDGRVYVGSDDGRVYCLDALTGNLTWSYATGDRVRSSPAVADGRVYVGSDDGTLYCLESSTGASIWNYTTTDWMQSSPAVADGKVYVGSFDGNVYCLNASTGSVIWSYATGIAEWSSPAVSDGIVFIGSGDSHVYAFGNVIRVPEDFQTLQQAIDAAGPDTTIWVAPDVYNVSIVINKTVTIIGKVGSAPIFSGGGSGIAITLTPNASGSIIAGVVITSWDQGILINGSANCRIYDNVVSLMRYSGVMFEGVSATGNSVEHNVFQQNIVAVNLTSYSINNTICRNVISQCDVGLSLQSGGHIVYANSISGSNVGIALEHSSGNKFYHNNFIDNTVQISISESTGNMWDDGYPSGGNYWSGHLTTDNFTGPQQNIPSSDGIVDVHFAVANDNIDNYPLAWPFSEHNIGITSYVNAKTAVGRPQTFRIELNILNLGVCNETFTLTAYANNTIIGRQAISLTLRKSVALNFTLSTANIAYGLYRVRVVASVVQGETESTDNSFVTWINVTIPGDINGNSAVDIFDAILLSRAYGTEPGIFYWNADADIDDNDIVDIFDAILLSNHYDQQWS